MFMSFLNRKHGYLVRVIVTAQETVLVEDADNVKAMKQGAWAKESAKSLTNNPNGIIYKNL